MDYKKAGVDREKADQFVSFINEKARGTLRTEAGEELGDFGGFFRAPSSYKEPVWVATTDGVGTKLLLAEEIGGEAHRNVGQDVVAMCVNDLLACRAEPLIFLDYLATGKLNRSALDFLMEGMVEGCKLAGCALIGGETAEMPGFYPEGRYDVAGFSVGVLEKKNRFQKSSVQPGDFIMGLPSSGFHSNGYSLIRKILTAQKWALNSKRDGMILGEALLRPTPIYVKDMFNIFRSVSVKGAAHITGGGLLENLPRCVDSSKVKLVLQKEKIPTPPWMKTFADAGKISEQEAFSTWNMGIGFCFLIDPKEECRLPSTLFQPICIGVVEQQTPGGEEIILS